jgi:hypothetical protein
VRFLVLLGLLVSLVAGGPVATAAQGPAPRRDLVEALEVLHGWDARREQAWAAADERALRSLYVRGSAAGRADVRLLRDYTGHGLVVRRIMTQVFAVTVLEREARMLRLNVFDRVAGGQLLHRGDALPLGSSEPATRTVELRSVSGRWLVVSISGSERDPRAAPR